MRARIWKDRMSGLWCFAVGTESPAWRPVVSGARLTWESALFEVFAALDVQHAVRM